MGIAALRKILAPEPLDTSQLAGRVAAVDADNLIWSFATALGASGELPKAPDGRPVAHLYGLAGRLGAYAGWGLRTAWVFDGVQPGLKDATLIARAERIEAARAAGNEKGAIEITPRDLQECRTVLDLLGIPNMVAPGESDAQCAHLTQVGHAWAAVTQDWDIALFGAPRALRNLTTSTTRLPELLDLATVLDAAGLTREQLVEAAMLIGTDYNPGIDGVGPVKAVKLAKQGPGTPERLGIANADEVRKLYFDHPRDQGWKPVWRKPDVPALAQFLAGRGIGMERARPLLDAAGG